MRGGGGLRRSAPCYTGNATLRYAIGTCGPNGYAPRPAPRRAGGWGNGTGSVSRCHIQSKNRAMSIAIPSIWNTWAAIREVNGAMTGEPRIFADKILLSSYSFKKPLKHSAFCHNCAGPARAAAPGERFGSMDRASQDRARLWSRMRSGRNRFFFHLELARSAHGESVGVRNIPCLAYTTKRTINRLHASHRVPPPVRRWFR